MDESYSSLIYISFFSIADPIQSVFYGLAPWLIIKATFCGWFLCLFHSGGLKRCLRNGSVPFRAALQVSLECHLVTTN